MPLLLSAVNSSTSGAGFVRWDIREVLVSFGSIPSARVYGINLAFTTELSAMTTREETNGLVRLTGENGSFTFERPRPGVMLVRISGYDNGEFDTAPLDEVTAEMRRFPPLELFVDASEARGAAWKVSQQWTSWFRNNREFLSRVHILVQSKFVKQTILVAKELSRTNDLIYVHTDAERFEALLDECVARR